MLAVESSVTADSICKNIITNTWDWQECFSWEFIKLSDQINWSYYIFFFACHAVKSYNSDDVGECHMNYLYLWVSLMESFKYLCSNCSEEGRSSSKLNSHATLSIQFTLHLFCNVNLQSVWLQYWWRVGLHASCTQFWAVVWLQCLAVKPRTGPGKHVDLLL